VSACDDQDVPAPGPDFSACDPDFVVSLDSVPDRTLHPAFAAITPQALGDSLGAVDHAIAIDADHRLHCFWTRGIGWDNGLSFGHASSADLIEWELHPSITLASETHVIDRVWAPQVFQSDGRWQMYFTAVELAEPVSKNVQRIMVATSDDLFQWSGAELALEPRHEQVAWGTDIPFANDARDQVVFRNEDRLRMLLTVRLPNGMQSLALAEERHGTWNVVHVLASIQEEVVESAFLYAVDGQLKITFNNWRVPGQALWTAQSLTGHWSLEATGLRGFGYEMIALDGGYTMVSRVWGSSVLLTQTDLGELSGTNMVFPDCYTGSAHLLPARTPVWEVNVR
jgi:sucrose-6-phosphate hydrolase SacC (GH32 family)